MLLFRLKRYINIKVTYKKDRTIKIHYDSYILIHDSTNNNSFTNGIPICCVFYSKPTIAGCKIISVYIKKNKREFAYKCYDKTDIRIFKYFTWNTTDVKKFIKSFREPIISLSNKEPHHVYYIQNDYNTQTNINQNITKASTVLYSQNIPPKDLIYIYYSSICVCKNMNNSSLTLFVKNKYCLKQTLNHCFEHIEFYNSKEIDIRYKNIQHIILLEYGKKYDIDQYIANISDAINTIDNYRTQKNIAKIFKRLFSELEEIKNSINKKPKLF